MSVVVPWEEFDEGLGDIQLGQANACLLAKLHANLLILPILSAGDQKTVFDLVEMDIHKHDQQFCCKIASYLSELYRQQGRPEFVEFEAGPDEKFFRVYNLSTKPLTL